MLENRAKREEKLLDRRAVLARIGVRICECRPSARPSPWADRRASAVDDPFRSRRPVPLRARVALDLAGGGGDARPGVCTL